MLNQNTVSVQLVNLIIQLTATKNDSICNIKIHESVGECAQKEIIKRTPRLYCASNNECSLIVQKRFTLD